MGMILIVGVVLVIVGLAFRWSPLVDPSARAKPRPNVREGRGL